MENPIDSTQTFRKGWLKNGNPPGDVNAAPRCGAKTRRGAACQATAMRNGRCRMHGGASTGPRTQEGYGKIAALALEARAVLFRSYGGTEARTRASPTKSGAPEAIVTGYRAALVSPTQSCTSRKTPGSED